MKWQTVDEENYVEVSPVEDTREHWKGDECWCIPEVERKEGSRPLISHNRAPRLYEHTTPYNAHTHFDANKALNHRLAFLNAKLKESENPNRLHFVKAERQAIKYALSCLEFTKANSWPNNAADSSQSEKLPSEHPTAKPQASTSLPKETQGGKTHG